MANALPTLKEGFTTRPITLDDVPAAVSLFNDYWRPAVGLDKFSVEDVRNWFGVPGFDLATSSCAVLAAGQLVGSIVVMDIVSPPVHPEAIGCVHQDYVGRGIGTFLLRWAIQRASQAISRVPEGARVSLYLSLPGAHEPTVRLFARLGIAPIRHSWLMVIDLAQAPPEPAWPAGIVVRTYQDLPDLRAVYRAASDAFRDHWGHVDRPEEEGLRRWQHQMAHDPTFDPTLWFLALDGDEIAGVSLCRPAVGNDPDTGFVNTLGVRRPWRRAGLALALLQHTFGEFYRRGRKRVALGVDAGSLTGATRLYEKAGMHVAQQITMCEIELRPGQELGRQSLEEQLPA